MKVYKAFIYFKMAFCVGLKSVLGSHHFLRQSKYVGSSEAIFLSDTPLCLPKLSCISWYLLLICSGVISGFCSVGGCFSLCATGRVQDIIYTVYITNLRYFFLGNYIFFHLNSPTCDGLFNKVLPTSEEVFEFMIVIV